MNNHVNVLLPRVVLWGGTGQAKVVRPIIEHYGAKVVAVFDDTPGLAPPFLDVPLYHGWRGFLDWRNGQRHSDLGFCVAIGNPHGRVRMDVHDRLAAEGLAPMTVAHHTAYIAPNAHIGSGCQIMAGAVVGAETRIGRQCIINTMASVDHECVLEDGVEIAPGATLCGLITVGMNGFICAGATVLPRRRVGVNAVVGAGAVVVRDVPDNTTVIGVPARERTRK